MSRGPTRRQFLATAGVASTVALAGCGGGGGSNGSGDDGGFRWLYGDTDRAFSQNLRRLVNANAQGVQIDLRKGGSDVENVQAVNRGDADFAMVGGDIAFFAREGTGLPAFQSQQEKLRGIGAMYPRPVTIFKNPTLEADNLSELTGPTINVGETATALSLNADQILSGSQVQFTPERAGMIAGVEQAANGEIDAAVAIGDWPIPRIQELARSTELAILELNQQTRERALSNSQWFVNTRLPAAVYEGVNYPVNTVGGKAILVTSEDLSEGQVVRVSEAIYDNTDQITVRGQYVSQEAAEDGLPISLHEGANSYLNF